MPICGVFFVFFKNWQNCLKLPESAEKFVNILATAFWQASIGPHAGFPCFAFSGCFHPDLTPNGCPVDRFCQTISPRPQLGAWRAFGPCPSLCPSFPFGLSCRILEPRPPALSDWRIVHRSAGATVKRRRWPGRAVGMAAAARCRVAGAGWGGGRTGRGESYRINAPANFEFLT